MHNNKKIFFWFFVLVLSNVVLEILSNRETGVIKQRMVVKSSTAEIFDQSKNIKSIKDTVLLTRWFPNKGQTGIYSYDFETSENKFIDWSMGDKAIKLEEGKLVYKSEYNQISVVNFEDGKKEIINILDVQRNLEDGLFKNREIEDFLLFGERLFYIYHPCSETLCNYSIRVYDKKLRETKIIKDDIGEILPHGGIELDLYLDKYDENSNKLFLAFGGGDVCVSFSESYSIDIETAKLANIKTDTEDGCPTESSELVKPMEFDKKEYKDFNEEETKAYWLSSTDYCGELKILNYGSYYPLEVFKNNLKKVIDEDVEKGYSDGDKANYEFLGCIR